MQADVDVQEPTAVSLLSMLLLSTQNFWVNFLADRTDARSVIGYWHDTVIFICLSDCLSHQNSNWPSLGP